MLAASHMTIGYRIPVAGPLDFSFRDGECVMLCGPNGSGKSTLMKTLAGLLKPLSGSYEARGTVVMVPTHIPKVKGFTVEDFIRTGMYGEAGIFRKLDKEAERVLGHVMGILGLGGLAGKDLGEVSDGEFQKACIATALTRNAGTILLDEPTAFLDVDNRIMVLETLQRLSHSTGATILFSTHDIYDGARYSDATLALGH